MPPPNQYVSRVNRRDTRLRARRQETWAPQTSTSNRPAPPRAPLATSPPQGTTDVGTHPGPMNLSANRRRITQQERTRRISQGCASIAAELATSRRNAPSDPRTPFAVPKHRS